MSIAPKPKPVGAEARGKVRLFRQKLQPNADRINDLIETHPPALQDEIEAWVMKKGVGRARAVAKIKKRLPGVRWHKTHHPVLLGAYLMPIKTPLIADPADEGQMQTSIIVKYFIVTGEENTHIGPWTLEIPDHALGRIIERAPRQMDLEDLLFAAHNEALLIGLDDVIELLNNHESFLVRTPYGAFLSEFEIGHYETADKDARECIIRPRTWLSEDQLFDNQIPLPHGMPSLGASLLMPGPTRRLITTNNDKLRWEPNEYAYCLDFFMASELQCAVAEYLTESQQQ